MTWTAPDVTRVSGPLAGDERPMLVALLAWHRSTLLLKCAGLTGEQLAERPAAPSTMSLLGLIRHLTEVERTWFRRRLAGEAIGRVYPDGDRRDVDFDDTDPGQAEADYARLVEEWRRCDAVAAAASLDDVFDLRGEDFSLRMIYLHLIGEYARHNGHADLLRERVDGVTGA